MIFMSNLKGKRAEVLIGIKLINYTVLHIKSAGVIAAYGFTGTLPPKALDRLRSLPLQGCLAHKKQRPPNTLQ